MPDGSEAPISGQRCHAPFITWPVQDDTAQVIIGAIKGGGDLNLEKSRDMGASWLILAIIDWFFLFKSNVNFGLVSRKEELVDKPGDMDTLFEKVRYIHRMLPPWQLPTVRDRFMFMHNLELNSTIAGESTNADVGRGGRRTAYLVDEAAAIPNGESVENSLSQNTACQIWATTPHGPNTQFHIRVKEKRGKLLQMPWWRHPEKAKGAFQIMDPQGKIKWTSPWYQMLDTRFSKKTIAQEVDMDHGQAGDMFFDYTELERHRQDHQTEPLARGDLIVLENVPREKEVEWIGQMDDSRYIFVKAHNRAPWRFWCDLPAGRPPQYWSYVFGIDVSNGAGGGGSNSVISVMALEPGQIVAKFWDSYTSPEELALVAARAGVWFGGLRPPAYICWENNGPGGIFGRKLVDMGYPYFYKQKIDNSVKKTKTPRWGWHSTPDRKNVLLGLYRDALNRDALVNPCKESLDEAADYIYGPNKQIIPSIMREEDAGGQELHGDHVIADALCWLAQEDLPRIKAAPIRPPKGTFAYRRERQMKARKEKDPWKN